MMRFNLLTGSPSQLAVVIIGLMVTLPLNAQELVTDRPDQTESSSVVPHGRLQIESGVAIETAGTTGELDELSRTSFGTLVRVGLLERFELRVATTYASSRSYLPCLHPDCSGGRTELLTTRFDDLAIGTKVAITDERGLLPETALLLHIGVPLTNDSPNPAVSVVDFRFSMSHTLSERFSLGYNIGAESSDGDNRGAGVYTLALGMELVEKVGGYVELFGRVAPRGEPEHLVDGGLTWSPLENVQFDLSGGIGFQPRNAARYLAIGLSFRLPE